MSVPPGSTLNDDESLVSTIREPYLIVALHAHHPERAPSRHRLSGLEEVRLGRTDGGAGLARTRARLELGLDDGFLSGRHARLARVLGRWVLEDVGSTNGTFVNGDRVREIVLSDGDVIEVGRTFLVFRIGPELAGPDDVDAGMLDAVPPGLATLAPALAGTLGRVAHVARSSEPILFGGETGSGKDVVARAVHAASGRRGAFVAVNCGALPETLAEAELFGHRKGAFSGAVAERTGYVRAAEGGTLFLDEIADLRPPSQAALLRVLQERQVVPLGSERPLPVDVRFLAATHKPLAELVARGEFRADLYARLNGFHVEVPPLRARREDLGLLVRALLARRGARVKLSGGAARALFAHEWPFNVRELDQALGTALALPHGGTLERAHLPAALGAGPVRTPMGTRPPSLAAGRRPLSEKEIAHRAELVRLLREHGGNIAAVGRLVGKGRQQIHRWLERYGLDAESFRS